MCQKSFVCTLLLLHGALHHHSTQQFEHPKISYYYLEAEVCLVSHPIHSHSHKKFYLYRKCTRTYVRLGYSMSHGIPCARNEVGGPKFRGDVFQNNSFFCVKRGTRKLFSSNWRTQLESDRPETEAACFCFSHVSLRFWAIDLTCNSNYAS